jgi:hypothetical protein
MWRDIGCAILYVSWSGVALFVRIFIFFSYCLSVYACVTFTGNMYFTLMYVVDVIACMLCYIACYCATNFWHACMYYNCRSGSCYNRSATCCNVLK